jgi:Nif-specific regulatory protein
MSKNNTIREELEKKLKEKEEEFFYLSRSFSYLSLKLSVFQEMHTLINTVDDLHLLLEKIMEIVLRVMEAESGSILLIDEEKNQLYFEVAKGPKGEEVKKYRLNLDEGIVGWVVTQNEPVVLSEVKKDPRFKKEISEAIGYEVKSIICVPIRIRGKVKGAIEVLNKIPSDVFIPDDVDLLSSIAMLTGIMMDNLLRRR